MNTTKLIRFNGAVCELQTVLRDKNLLPHQETIRARINRGWSPNRAINKPINKYQKQTHEITN